MKTTPSPNSKYRFLYNNKVIAVVVAVAVAIVGLTLIATRAVGPFASLEAEQTTISGSAAQITDTTASAGKALQFNAPLVTPPTPGRSWPTPSNTGATGTLTTVNGDVELDTPGEVYANMRVNGTIAVTACNVIIRNVEVDQGTADTEVYGIWLKQPETCGATIDHVSVQANPAPNNYLETGIRDAYGAPAIITASKIIGSQDGIDGLGSGTLQDNYIMLGATSHDAHNDGFQLGGSSGIVLKHNTILNPNSETSALALFTEFGPNKNMVVEDNLLAGGGFTCYCGDGKSDNSGASARAQNVSFVNNVFWKKYYPNVGYWAPGRAYNPAGGGVWQNNLYMEADGTLTSNKVEQPPIDQ